MNSSELLKRFARDRSEEVFCELMGRYVHLVFSVAQRRLQDQTQIEEAVQDVFIRLARLDRVPPSEAELVRWLHATVHRISIDRWRQESRRQEREMKALPQEDASPEPVWKEVAPLLDDAIAELEPPDRDAILLRFFKDVPFRDVAQLLGVTDAAAKMRTRRALDKLRDHLIRKGLTGSSAALAAMLDEYAVISAPASLAARTVSVVRRSVFVAGRVLLKKSSSFLSLKTAVVALMMGGGIFLWLNRSRPARPWDRARSLPSGMVSNGIVRPTRRTIGAPVLPLENATTADLMARLRFVLDQAHRLQNYPPNELLQVLLECHNNSGEVLALLTEYLSSSDYETRHWAAEGLQVLVQDTQFKEVRAAARLALMRIAVSPSESEVLRQSAFMAAISHLWGNGIHLGTELYSEPIAEDLLQAFAQSFTEKGADMVSYVGGRATALGSLLTQTKQDFTGYRQALESTLTAGDSNQRMAAAIALAALPGDKVPEVKAELLRLLATDTWTLPQLFAVQSLGQLGSQASDAIPALEKYAEDHPQNSIEKKEMIRTAIRAIQTPVAEASPGADGSPELTKVPADPKPEFSSLADLFTKITEELKDPETRRAFVPKDRWMAISSYWAVESTRKIRDEIADKVDPEIADLIRQIPIGLHALEDTPIDLEAKAEPLEFIGRAVGVAERADNGISAESLARVKELLRRESSMLDRAADLVLGNSRADKLVEVATALGAIDPKLYQATVKSYLDYHPEMDRLLRGTEPVASVGNGRKKP